MNKTGRNVCVFKEKFVFLHIKTYKDLSDHTQCSTSQCFMTNSAVLRAGAHCVQNGFKGAFPQSFKKHSIKYYARTFVSKHQWTLLTTR